MANNDGKIVLGLDIPKTVSQMNADIKKLQKQLAQVKLTGALDTSSTVKQINAQIAALQSQIKTVDIKANVNTSEAQKVGEEFGKTVTDFAQEAIDGITGGLFDGSKINVEDYSDALEKIRGLQIEDIFIGDKVDVDAFAKAVGTSDTNLIGYVETLNAAKGKTDLTTVSTEGLSEYLRKTGNSFNFAAVKATLLNTALNAGISFAASIALQALVKGLDNFINRAKYAKEAMEEAQSAIDSSQNNLRSMSDILSNNRERFLELSQGVDKFSKNLSLSEEDYAEYLSLSNQLTELSPSLVSGYDEQGNALLALGSNADETNEKLQSVLETQQAIAQQTLIDNMDAVANGVYFEVKDTKNSIGYLESQLSDLQQQYKEVNVDIVNSDGLFSFDDESYSKYGKLLEDAFTSAGVEFERVIGLYDTGIQLISASPEQLNQAQKFYDAQIESENEYYRASENGLKQDIEAKENSIEASYAKMSANLQAWMKNNYNYQYLSDNTSAMADALVSEIKWDELAEPPRTAYDYQNYIKKNIINPLMEVPIEHKGEVDDMFHKLLSFEDGDLDVLQFAEQLREKLHEWNIEIDITPIIADEQAAKEKLDNSIRQISDDHGIADRKQVAELTDYTKDFTQSQAELWLESTQDAKNATQAIEMYENALKKAKEESLVTPTISSSVQQIATQLEPQFAKLGEAYQTIFTSDGFTLDGVDNSMLENLRQSFAEIESEVGVAFDASKLDSFFDALTNGSSTAQQVHDAFNDLATAYFYSTETLEQLNAKTADAIEKQLEEMGVTNASEVVYDTLNAKMEALALQKQFAADTGHELVDAAADEVASFLSHAGASNIARAYLFQLTAAEQVFNNQDLNPKEKIEKLKELATQYGQTAIAARIANMELAAENGHTSINYENELASLQNEINGAINNIQLDFGGVGGGTEKAGSAGKSVGSTYVDAFENELEELQQLKDDGVITEKEYLDRLRALNEKYFKDKLGYEKEFSKYQRQYLEGYKSLYESALSGISKLLSRQIDGYNDAKDAAVSSLNEEKESRLEVIDAQKEQLEAEKDLIDEQIKQKQETIDQIQDEIQKMKDANDERKRQLDLQKAQYELERMQHQRTMLVNYMPGTIVI